MTFEINMKNPVDSSDLILKVDADDERNIEICTKYWLLDETNGKFAFTVKELEINLGLTAYSISNTVKEYAHVTSSNFKCNGCLKNIVFENRTAYRSRYPIKYLFCQPCFIKHLRDRESALDFDLSIDVKAKKINSLEDKKAFYLELKQDFMSQAPELWTLDVKTRFYLITLFFGLGDESSSFTIPLASAEHCLSPRTEYDVQILTHLVDSSVIFPNFSDDSHLMELFTDERNFTYNVQLCDFEMAYSYDDFCGLLSDVGNYNSIGVTKGYEFVELCKEVQLNECLSIMEFLFNEHQLSFTPSEKMNLVFAKALETYSVAQVYSFIWRAVKKAVGDNYLKPAGVSKVTTTYVANGILQSLIKHITGNWTVKNYTRPHKLPKSLISFLVFEQTLNPNVSKSDDNAFNQPIHILLGVDTQAQADDDDGAY